MAGRRFSDLDAVTLDAYGTLLELDDPVGALASLLPGHDRDAIGEALAAEIDFYRARSHEGRDAETLGRLREASTAVFNEALGSDLSPDAFVGALSYRFLPGAEETVRALRARGLSLAVVANWDAGLAPRLETLAVPVVTSAEAGTAKPDPRIFALALERLGVEPSRALHVGNEPVDEEGAAAAGMRFAPAPLATAFEDWR